MVTDRLARDRNYYGPAAQKLEFSITEGRLTEATATAAERHPDSMNVPEYLNDSNHYWSFFVRNTGQGYFEATSSRYWDPINISSDVRKAGSRSKATGTNQDELNPQPLPPCEKCPEMRKTTEEKKKPR